VEGGHGQSTILIKLENRMLLLCASFSWKQTIERAEDEAELLKLQYTSSIWVGWDGNGTTIITMK